MADHWRRFVTFLSRPKIFAIIMLIIVLLGATTWAIDRYLLQLVPTEKQAEFAEGLSTAARIQQRGALRVGVRADFPPFGLRNEAGGLEGFDMDLAREFARRWLGDETAVEFQVVTPANRVPALAAGEVDLLIASMPHKRERDALIDFSQTYFVDGPTLLVRADSEIYALSDLNGRRLAAIQGASAIEQIRNRATRDDLEMQVLAYPEYPQALGALGAGQVDALVADVVTLARFAQNNPGLRILGERLAEEPYGIGIPQGDSHLRAMVNFTLQDMKADGTYDAIYARWFSSDEPYAIEISPGEWPYTLGNLPSQSDAAVESTIQDILNRGYILAGVSQDLPPFGSQDEQGTWEGFDLDLLREFAQRWLGDANAVQIIPASTEENIARLAAGEIDLLASGLIQRREWNDIIDFSQTYIGPPLVTEPLSIGVPQRDSSFRELVDVTLQEMAVDGTYERLQSHWFGASQALYALEVLPGDADYLLLPYREAATAPRITAAGDSTIKDVKDREGVLIVGVRFDAAPFGYLDEAGEPTGFDVELVRAMAQEWGVVPEFVPVTPSDQVQKLVQGDVDLVAAAMRHTKEQEAEVAFSQTYFVNGQNLLVQADSNIHALTDLGGQRIAAVQGASSIDLFQALADANGLAIEIAAYPSYQDALDAVRSGQAAALVADNVALTQFAKADAGLRVLEQLFATEPYGMGLPPGDSYFNALVNFTLQSIKEQGIYDELYRTWFGENAPPYDLEILPGTWPYTFAESPTTLDKPVQSKVEEIRNTGKIVAGVQFDFKPFGYLGAGGQLAGFDVDLLREFAKRWLGDANAVEFVPVTAANRINMLVAGEVDIVAASLIHNRESDELIDFSQTYFEDGQSVLVRRDGDISTLRHLDGRVVAAVQGSTAINNIQIVADELGISFDILPFQEYPQALEALRAGQVDALTTVMMALMQAARENPELAVVDESFIREPYGLGIPNYDDRFQDLVNFTLQEMQQDGTYSRLLNKWFGSGDTYTIETWPGNSYLDMDLVPMVRVPEGEFLRGNAAGFPDERFEQVLYLDEFFIDQYEVTNRHYAECVQAGRCTLPRLPRSVNFGRYYAESGFGNYPVIWVSWEDAAAYCEYMGKRLPTEAEWEKAARGVENWIYPWGNEEPTTQANFNYIQRDVAPVGSFPQDVSYYGVHDMAGNVREWVGDWYQWDYYPNASLQNPQGPAEGVTRVLRGGSWNDVAIYLRSTTRKNFLPESYDSNLGFRCASSTFPPSR